MSHAILAIFGMPGGWELIVVGLVALLIFGRRLPDVARSVGKSIVEFKKGLKDVKNEIDVQTAEPPPERLEHKSDPKPVASTTPSTESVPRQEQAPTSQDS